MSEDSVTQIILTLITSAFTSGLSYGILRNKTLNLELRQAEDRNHIDKLDSLIQATRENFVHVDAMEKSLNHVYNQLNEMRKDVKDILKTVKS